MCLKSKKRFGLYLFCLKYYEYRVFYFRVISMNLSAISLVKNSYLIKNYSLEDLVSLTDCLLLSTKDVDDFKSRDHGGDAQDV